MTGRYSIFRRLISFWVFPILSLPFLSTHALAQCTPTSAKICASGDDVTTIYVGGTLIGTFPYAGAPGTGGAANPTCFTVSTALLTGPQVCLAIATQNTAPQNNYSTWDLDITCSGGQHSEITSAGTGISVDYVAGCNPCAPPPNDGGGNTWYSTNYTGTAFSSSYCPSGVTISTWAAGLFDPTTGVQVPFISNNCSGDYGSANGALFWRQCATIPAPSTLVGPPNLTISQSQSGIGGALPNSLAITYQIVVCNTGGPATNSSVTIADNFLANTSNQNIFQFGCWGTQGSLCDYSGFYGPIPASSSSNNYIFSYFPNGCVTLAAAVTNYYYCTTCNPAACVSLVDQASVTWVGGNANSNAVTYAPTCIPTFTPTSTSTNSPTGTLIATATTTSTPTNTMTSTATNTPVPTGSSVPTGTPSPCAYNLNSGQPCTFVQSASTDNCVTSGSAPSTEAINQFYSYGASGVSVLFCSGSSTTVNNGSTISMLCSPPAGATIVKAILDVVELNSGASAPVPSTGPVNFAGQTTGAGIMTGTGNLWNIFNDPRYGYDITSYPDQTAFNVRYDVTGQVSTGTASYSLSYPNLAGGNYVWSASLVIVYTVPAAGVCGGVALSDGVFYWYVGDPSSGTGRALRDGVTPNAPTVDWSCQDPTTLCGTNHFSYMGGSQYGTAGNSGNPVTFLDNFYGDPSGTGGTFMPASEWNTCSSCGAASPVLGDFSNVTTSGTNKITWGLGNALDTTGKQAFWMNMMAGGCNSSCVASSTPTSTASSTPTNSPVITFTPTPTPTGTPSPATSTPTNSVTTSPTFFGTITPTNTATSTGSPFTATPTTTNTITSTPTNTPSGTWYIVNTYTNTPTSTGSPSNPTSTPTLTTTNTPTSTMSVTNTATATRTTTNSPTLTPTYTGSPMLPSETSTATLTPTNTATTTYSNTPTSATPSATATATNTGASFTPTHTFTPTPTATRNHITVYPNPCTGDVFNIIRPPGGTGPERVTIALYSVCYRRILQVTITDYTPQNPISVNIFDVLGYHISNGLYYVVVTTPGGRYTEKLLVLR